MKFRIRDAHPRVLLRPDDLTALRRRATTTHGDQMRALRALAGAGAEPGSGGDYSDSVFRLSFLHLLSDEAAHAQVAIEGLRKLLDLDVSGEYFVGARRLKALAASYDWMHAALGDELRERVGRRALEYCQALYDSGEVEPDCYFLGHAINQMPFILMAGIAIGDELPGATRFVEDTLDRWEKQSPCYRHFLEQECFQQSMSYTCTYVAEFPWLFSAIEAGLGIEMYRPNAWFANVVKWWTYAQRDDASFIRFGDYFCATPALENPSYYRPFAAIASRYRDGRAQWWVNRFRIAGSEVDQILFEDRPGVAPQPPDDLPRTKLFAAMGVAIARGDFDRGTVASFKCSPLYLHNHGHRDANSFTIYHKGEQAIDSGGYDAYESPQWYNYYVRTIAHNTLVVHDPNERFISRGNEYANDGGQRFINEPHFQPTKFDDIASDTFSDGTILAYRDGNGFSYVCGDASNCYSKEKLTRFVRHVTFVLDWPNKGCVSLVVLDEVELARDGLEPRFLLHTMEEPRVESNRILAEHKGGRLTTTALLPQAPRIETIGGPGREFEVDGKNYPLKRKLNDAYTPGEWRAEISDDSGAGRMRKFLTLLVPSDADAPREPQASVVESPAGWVVRQGDLAVALVRPGRQIALNAPRSIHIDLAS
ncbi:MAG: heparin/heparan-sulfate lyase [Phycisphaerales bacterium]|nr:heparin/heparan-sulfate lyase [Phycisphaerales bacterium]